jgi:TM2 domain-containing membrane protein YozV
MVCPYCRGGVEDGAGGMVCQGCNTPHHQECFDENGGCTLFGCKFAPPDEPKIQVSNSEAAIFGAPTIPQFAQFSTVPQRPATGFGDVSQTWQLIPQTVVAPPRTSAVPPPPRLLTTPTPWPRPAVDPSAMLPEALAATTDQTTAGNGAGTGIGYVTPGGIFDTPAVDQSRHASKSRLVYILLGIFLGALGAHNIYAGFYKRAAAQIALSVLTVFYGSIITWIWALAEVCTVDRDADRIAFS